MLIGNFVFSQVKDKIVEEKIIICTFPVLPDRKPDFPGGIQNLNKIIKNEIGRKAVTGKAFFFEFTIDKNGNTKSIEIKDDKKYFKEKHIKKVLKILPRWQPAMTNEKTTESKTLAKIEF